MYTCGIFFLLMLIPGAGDELQGIKKGVIELSDALLINKADGENEIAAKRAQTEYNHALHYLMPATKGWETRAHLCSALTGTGIPEVWKIILKFVDVTKASNTFEKRRNEQMIEWLHNMIEESIKEKFYSNPKVKEQLPVLKKDILSGRKLPPEAVEILLRLAVQ